MEWPTSQPSRQAGRYPLKSLNTRFFKNSGQFTFTLLGLAALALFLLYYATAISGIRFFARRSLALLIDLGLVSIALFAFVSYYRIKLEKPEDILQMGLGNLLMLALWVAFLCFAVFDWRFNGTLGKRFLGLRVVGVERNRISFGQSFIRAFLSLPLPVIGATLLGHWVMGQGQSTLRLFFGDALKSALVAFVPMSIMFLEGNQSIADRLTRTAICGEHEAMNLLPRIRWKTWALLCFSNVAWAFLVAALWYIGMTRPLSYGPSELPTHAEAAWIVKDPQTTAALWVFLPMGLKEPTFGIRTIQLLEISPNPFTFDPAKSHFLPPLNPQPYLKAIPKMPVVRVTLARERPLQVKLFVLENFLNFVGQKTPPDRRPAFTVLQIATDQEFGLFSITGQENILVGWATSAKGMPLTFIATCSPREQRDFTFRLIKSASS
jgi:uncharacterized RDD family membrane protein YckC